MKINPWHLVVGLSLALAFMLVWNSSLRRTSEEQSVKIVELERELTIKQDEEYVKTKEATIITEKPDGTKITEIIKEENSTKVSAEIADKEKVKQVDVSTKKVTNDRERYSVGIYSDVRGLYGASAGAVLGDLPLEAVILSTENFKHISMGVQFRW